MCMDSKALEKSKKNLDYLMNFHKFWCNDIQKQSNIYLCSYGYKVHASLVHCDFDVTFIAVVCLSLLCVLVICKTAVEVPVVQWLSSLEMDTVTQIQILDKTDCILHSTSTLRKGMNTIILTPAMGK